MSEIKGSRTEENLRTAFAGESQARNKYTYYASVARAEGYEHIAAIFQETADNEKEHAKIWFKALGELGDTAANLKAAAAGENYESTTMYKEFAAEARKEGFNDVAALFELVGKIESEHEKRYAALLDNLASGTLFLKEDVVIWKCRNCGHIHIGKRAPGQCAVCKHPQSYFEAVGEAK